MVILLINFRSLFLAIAAVFISCFSIPLTGVLCRGIFRVNYLGQLHLLIPYVVICVSAPIYFVMHEVWVETSQFHFMRDSNKKRMAFTIRKTHRVASVVQIVAVLSLFCNIVSPLTNFKSFGIYAGVIILINYILAMILFPTMLIFYETTVVPYFFVYNR